MGRCLGTTPWDNSDLGVALKIAKVRKIINFSIFAYMGQVKGLLASMTNINADGVVY